LKYKTTQVLGRVIYIFAMDCGTSQLHPTMNAVESNNIPSIGGQKKTYLA
jgi:hypothetical protein